jgi:FkbM family methyltransferase
MASLTTLCTLKPWKTRFFKYIFTIPRIIKLPHAKLEIEFAGSRIPFIIPLEYFEYALLNLEHVFVDCDYFQVEYAIPTLGCSVLDVGGFIGFYSSASSRLCGVSGTVYVFEPNPLVVSYLARNAELSASSGAEIRVFPLAICGESGVAELYVGENLAVSSTVRDHVEFFTRVTRRVKVKCTRLSSVLRYLGHVDIVKLDVEGLELELLREARGELNRVRVLVVEVHRDLVETSEVRELLLNSGFRDFVVYTTSEMPYQVILYARR